MSNLFSYRCNRSATRVRVGLKSPYSRLNPIDGNIVPCNGFGKLTFPAPGRTEIKDCDRGRLSSGRYRFLR